MRIIAAFIFGLFLTASALADSINVPITLKNKLVVVTRDLTTATGSQAITGMGFQPTACLAAGTVANTPILAATAQFFQFFGMADASRSVVSTSVGAGAFIVSAVNFIEFVDPSGTNSQLATITSYDVDGLTLSWTKAGAPTGTASVYILCFR